MTLDLFLDVLLDAVIDTLKLVPFLYLTYLAMEALEHGAGGRIKSAIERSGKAGPAVGAVLGVLPQCGFSAMAATLYAGGVVTAGTLVAVVLSTSDEMIPVFVAHQAPMGRMLALLAFKLVVGLVAGFWVDALVRAGKHPAPAKHIHDLCEQAHCGCDDCEYEDVCECSHEHADEQVHECCCGHEDHGCEDHGDHECSDGCSHEGGDHGGSLLAHIAHAALIHTVQVTGFIFLVTLAFGLVIEGVGQDALGALLADHPVRATFLAALVGLIPNCGASVAITELYLAGTLPTGPMIAGLLSSGGVGLLVLWRTNPSVKQNLAITGCVYALAVVVGLAVGASGMLF